MDSGTLQSYNELSRMPHCLHKLYQGPLLLTLFNMDYNISNHIHSFLWDVITAPCPSLFKALWINCIPQFSVSCNDSLMQAVFTLLALCEGNPPVTGGFSSQRASNTGFDVFFDVSLNKRQNKQSSCRWFETPGWSLWRHHNGITYPYLELNAGFAVLC